jgi:hypothetical protein
MQSALSLTGHERPQQVKRLTDDTMTYSQQEVEMVRRQTIQIEVEKRALIRLLLIITSVALLVTLLSLGIVSYLYLSGKGAVDEAKARAADLESRLEQTTRELQEKTAQLERRAQVAAQRKGRFDELLAKALNQTASYTEVGELAKEIYESPQKVVEVQRMPPSSLFKYYKYRANNQVQTYVLVPGQVGGKWLIYSNLTGVSTPQS